nr:hypothetical protein Iba_chr11dCG8350 [Ipomoea batatas]GME15332.1 hypothetical protein Iba_scaffold16101CG0010 [Ipomoea batatas]
MPLLTSTPCGFRVESASHTFPGSAASDAFSIVSASSSTKTPTGFAPYSLATFEISFATVSEIERFELGHIIIPIKSAPASAAKAASLADDTLVDFNMHVLFLEEVLMLAECVSLLDRSAE